VTPFILHDPTETRLLPSEIVACSQEVVGLERALGCDFLITSSRIPVTDKTLHIHANKGIAVQRKDIGDLVSSMQGKDMRMWRQLIRLKLTCAYPMLLIIGDLKAKKNSDADGEIYYTAVVDGRETGIRYFAVIGAIEAWQRRGGLVTWLSRDALMFDWCNMQLRHLQKGWPTQYVPRVPIQGIELMTEVETTLATIPSIGIERARAIYDLAKQFWDRPTLIDCFRIVKDRQIDGIGKITKEKFLKFVGWTL